MAGILHKPNPWIDGVFNRDNNIDLKIFNQVLCNLQSQNANGSYLAVVKLVEFQLIIKNKNLNTPKAILSYLENNFQKNIIRWSFNRVIYQVGLLTKVKYEESTQEYIINIDDDLVNFALNYDKLQTGYTPINLGLTHKSKSFYSQRIYGMLRQWSGTKNKLTISIDDLKEKLLLSGRYNTYYDFKKRIINPVIKEINEKFNMKVEFKENKLGKAFNSITFTFIDYEPRHYNFKKIDSDEQEILKGQIGIEELSKDLVANNQVIDVKEVISSSIVKAMEELQICKIKLSVKTLERNLNIYGEDIFKRALNILISKKEEGEKITAPVKFLTGILEKLKINDEVAIAKVESAKTLSFTNYSQRSYDYDSLEKQLLGWDE